ncbi:MAG: energy-coupled thiamine transporter ThiT [Clostridia bacterium]|nr:energy-coupled thiamine transporter ThiT [Clostridia bacterium]MBR2012949.1 energy-coupled thiamine transporter ThiT [Clostridia bacterium]
MERKGKATILYLAQLGLLLAVVVVLQYIGNFIPVVAGINLTLIPIVVGAALLGPTGGLILGLACGLMTLFTPMAQGIMSYSPLMALLICFGKTGLAGFAAGWFYRWIAKKNRHIGIITASVATPIINTGLFVLGCSLLVDYFIGNPDAGFGTVAAGTSVGAFMGMICVMIAPNFIIEFLANAIASTAIYQVVKVVEKRIKK